ncbi:stathmin-4-like isoform X1 [Stigmatopora argus]
MSAALREKLQKLPLVSLLCSCIVGRDTDAGAEKEGTVDLKLGAIPHMEALEHPGGLAFRVVLDPPGFDGGPARDAAESARRPIGQAELPELLETREEQPPVVDERMDKDAWNLTEVS